MYSANRYEQVRHKNGKKSYDYSHDENTVMKKKKKYYIGG